MRYTCFEEKIITSDENSKGILVISAAITILWLRSKAENNSNMVARYLLGKGYKVIPVNPVQKCILGENASPILADIQEAAELLNTANVKVAMNLCIKLEHAKLFR